ncbi:actin-like ATPase domain-containing protein [Bimuria novae-zelandiae CBS 107.79]|uniref:Actin-like ATPase domain-containing protein n=1 Tax=Bimuria novae-zelandiae CBS 107.79 TaxID=1447943 RepID=A0A6A5VN71_9PLEO|nr:actin-like ATPase domain-containing protein [Bimuria novae-zelandiae CBS 107.79]
MFGSTGSRTGLTFRLTILISILSILLFTVPTRAESKEAPSKTPAPVIGIDFGDSYTRVAVKINATVRVLADGDGERSIPSYVALTEEAFLVGKAAKDYLKVQPERVIFDFSNFLGQTFEEVKEKLERKPYEIFDNVGVLTVRVPQGRVAGKTEYSIEEALSKFFVGVKSFVETALGQEMKEVVLPVPSYFNERKRAALKNAVELAGLTVLRMPTAPVVAAMAYGFGLQTNGPIEAYHILVHDIGGQNHDVSVLELEEGVFDLLGNAHTHGEAGAAFTAAVMGLLLEQNDEEEFFHLFKNSKDFLQYDANLEQAKHDLFHQVTDKVEIDIPGLKGTIARSDLEDEIMSNSNPGALIEKALTKANLTNEDIDYVILVGGSSRISIMREVAEGFFGTAPFFDYNVDPAEAVAVGAAIQAHILSDDGNLPLLNVEVVGSAIGVQTIEEQGTILVESYSIIPVSRSKIFTTVHDSQQELTIQLFEQRLADEIPERVESDDDRYERRVIGIMRLSELPAAPRGKVKIEVTLEIDRYYNLRAQASHVETGNIVSLTLENGPPYGDKPGPEVLGIPEGSEVALVRDEAVKHDEL